MGLNPAQSSWLAADWILYYKKVMYMEMNEKPVLETKQSFAVNTILHDLALDRKPIKQLVYIMQWAYNFETKIRFSMN